jgi:hypothetical protein
MHCRNGSKVSFIYNSYTFDAPVDKFIDITKSSTNRGMID